MAVGFSGAGFGNLTALETCRSVFIGGAVVALVLAYAGSIARCRLRAGRGPRRAASEIRLQNDFLGRGGMAGAAVAFLTFFHCSTEKGTVMKTFVAAKTITLSVSGMTCAACSDTVKKALQEVEGVEKTEVNYDKKEAVVTYDDAKTGVEALTKATMGAGYPSGVKK